MNRCALLLAIVGSYAGASAAIPPPPSPVEVIENTQGKTQPAAGVSLGTLKVTFESSTFADIAKLGAAPVGQQGDAGGFVMWVCFTLSDTRQRLWLTSSELGGRKFIDGITAQALPQDATPTADCPELSKTFRPVQLDSGVWLGNSIEELERKLGAPTSTKHAMYFAYLGKDRDFDVMSTLIVQLKDNHVETLHASHTTTN